MSDKEKAKTNLDANELADLIVENRLKAKQKAYNVFRQKCWNAVSLMAANQKVSTTVVLSDNDHMALAKVSEELRELGYKFRFIERVTVNEEGEELSMKHALHISLKHLID